MVTRAAFHSVPDLLLLLLALTAIPSHAVDLPWPLRLIESKNLAEMHQSRVARNEQSQRVVSEQAQLPVRVRKMSGDEGEMFLPQYWSFEADRTNGLDIDLGQKRTQPRSLNTLFDKDESRDCSNASISQPLQAPFALHGNQQGNARPLAGRLLKSPRDIFSLDQRAFSCPGGTTACTSINRPNSCCPNGSTCQSITDSGQGDVGCCGEGQNCGGEVAGCPEGNISCPDSAGGGCCVAGYACASVGCVASSTAITTIQPVVTASPPNSTPDPSSTTQAPAPVVPPASQSTSNTDAVTSFSTFTDVTSTIATATASSSSHTSSPTASTTTPKPTTTSSATAILPIRPTSSAIPTITTTDPPTTITASNCPTGFYQCSAYDHLGCCRVGRDCGLTSCPAASSTLAVNSNGVTVNVIPSGTGDAGGCATGWFSCAAGQGGGCCPSGYACGTSCTATGVVVQGGQTGMATVAKNNDAGVVEMGSWALMLISSASVMLLQLA